MTANRKSPSRKKTPVKSAAPRRPGKVRRDPERLTAAILDAAMAEFSAHGFAGARVDRISKGAGTVDRMLYYYFGNKERLYQAVLEEAYRRLVDAQRHFVPPEDPVRGMEALITQLWEYYRDHPEFVRLVMSENLLKGRYIQQSETIRQVSLPLIHSVEAVLDSGRRKGLFRADADARFVLMTIMSMGFFQVSNQYTYGFWLADTATPPVRGDDWLAHMQAVVLDHLRR